MWQITAAAGFTVAEDRVHDLRMFLGARMATAIRPRPHMTLDGVLSLGAATTEFCATLERVGSFGAGNPEPRFAFAAVRVRLQIEDAALTNSQL